MKITEIYQKYNVTPNLAEHMQSVSRVILFLQKHWQGGEIDWNEMLLIGQLHDIGNIVKFDFENYPELLGEEKMNIAFWKEKQLEMIQCYGTDDHLVTQKILTEIGLKPKSIQIVLDKSFVNTIKIADSNDWYTKILAYADMRVTPEGITSLDDRVEDIKRRMPKYTSRQDFNELVEAAYKIEKQIQAVVNCPLSQIESTNLT
jgi:hypothetical protein